MMGKDDRRGFAGSPGALPFGHAVRRFLDFPMPKLRNITDVLLRYLDAKQHVWNNYFYGSVNDLAECEPLDSFEVIDERMFAALVCHPLQLQFASAYRFKADPLGSIRLKPKSYLGEVGVRLLRPSDDGNSYWEPSRPIPARHFDASFIEFFEWDRYGFWGCSLVRCRIESRQRSAPYRGREAIIELRDVKFLLYAPGGE